VNAVVAEWGSHVMEAAQLKQSCVRGISTLQRITTKEAAREEVEKSRTRRRNQRLVLRSVVDPDPESDPDPVGSGTFCRIRIRNKSFRIRIRLDT
jgi:hypothetical protein